MATAIPPRLHLRTGLPLCPAVESFLGHGHSDSVPWYGMWGEQAGVLAGAHGKAGMENQLLLEQMSLCPALGLSQCIHPLHEQSKLPITLLIVPEVLQQAKGLFSPPKDLRLEHPTYCLNCSLPRAGVCLSNLHFLHLNFPRGPRSCPDCFPSPF